MQFELHSYRHADEILNAKLSVRREIMAVLEAVQGIPVKQGPDGLTSHLVTAFLGRGWEKEVPVAENQKHEQRFDLFKERVAVEIEFSRYEFVYRDYFRFLSAYNSDKIDVGVLITHHESVMESGRLKHPAVAPSLARVKDDLAWLRPTLTVPLWIVALKYAILRSASCSQYRLHLSALSLRITTSATTIDAAFGRRARRIRQSRHCGILRDRGLLTNPRRGVWRRV